MAKKQVTAKEFFSSILPDKLAAIEKVYDVRLSGLSASIFSLLPAEIIYISDLDFARILTFDEVIDAPIDMNVDFATLKLIPFIDLGDNDYISYDAASNVWCKFNIVDELRFDQRNNVTDYFVS